MLRVFSSGGGVQSTAALVLSAQGKIDYPVHVFANVGDKAESPATISYVRDIIKPYAARHDIKWVEVCKRDKKGNAIDLYDYAMTSTNSVPIPVRMSGSGAPGNRTCTYDWKIETVSRFLMNEVLSQCPDLKALALKESNRIRKEFRNSLGKVASQLTPEEKTTLRLKVLRELAPVYSAHSPCVLAKGISTDEVHRARTDSGFAHYSVEYPLIDLGLNRQDCQNIVLSAGLPLAPKSSCWFCPFKTFDRWQEMRREEPELFAVSVHMEKTLSDRAVSLGRGATYFTSRGTSKNAFLDEVTSDQMSLFEGLDLNFCESGFCMT